MLVYECENCKKWTIGGFSNEFEEHFCNEKCYKEYCEKNNYSIHLDRLRKINPTLN